MHTLTMTSTVLPAMLSLDWHDCAHLWLGQSSFSNRNCFTSCPSAPLTRAFLFSCSRNPLLHNVTDHQAEAGAIPLDPMSPPCTHRPISSLQQLCIWAALQEVWTILQAQCSVLWALTDWSTKSHYTVLDIQCRPLPSVSTCPDCLGWEAAACTFMLVYCSPWSWPYGSMKK